ncbi:uncharacterized protein PV09_03638 [Verruconis gallopava]|uniref:ML-like domain-containing protein n=1 Tax=Verruconis gallopava TaxID=253628 RepID=A0A0D2AFN3_9PEZI|nr:uncharacterized protein PV09_03638 [Verruconis gallopava]KIW05783.1 hypothetical protein PV09_03638 [Verruconis gallopava]
MKTRWHVPNVLAAAVLLFGALPAGVLGAQILQTDGFSSCGSNSDIQVQKLNISYDNSNKKVTFDVSGTSTKSQEVMAKLTVFAYGQQVYQNEFNPCDSSTKVDQLCPIPQGTFSAQGEQDIPTSYANMIPSIAFSVPNLDGTAKLELMPVNGGSDIACFESVVSNGKSMKTTAVSAIAAGIAAGALLVSALGALTGAGNVGGATPSPTFGEVVGWFQSMAMNGMLSVNYPSAYTSFSQNFGFSGLLIPWSGLETTIDNFRKSTGGNLTDASYSFLKNATIVEGTSNGTITKRGLDFVDLVARSLQLSQSNSTSGNSSESESKAVHFVHGIQGYVEQLSIPAENTFMTVLLIFAIVVAAIIVGILLFKVILEAWALFGEFPKRLTSFRKRYWWIMAKTITNLILLLYGVWTLYCVYQLVRGDSWAAKALAGVTLALFTAILAFFTWRIWSLARKYKKAEGDTSGLYENKETWVKYSLFYDSFKKGYWWMFIPSIIYMFTKGVIIAAGDGHGMIQTGGQLIVESLMLILLLWTRPYTLKSGQWINIIIQVVRVLSVLCILVFVEQLGISQTPKTVVGVVLIVMQSVLTGVLAILIAVNALITFFRMNPHRKARKDAEKINRDLDNLTPLDPRNSLLHPPPYKSEREPTLPSLQKPVTAAYADDDTEYRGYSYGHKPTDSQERLLPPDQLSMGGRTLHSESSNPSLRAPLLPSVDPRWRSQGY